MMRADEVFAKTGAPPMEQSPRLSLSYVAPNQAQKHVTVNETFRRLDALTQASVRSRTETAEPAEPEEGDAYVIPSGASGAAWDAFDAGDLAAFQDGAWARIAPFEGLRVWVADSDEFAIYDGAAWAALSGGGSSETAAKFGINTTADATNKLAVKADAALFNHDDVTPGSGDMRIVVNKASAGDTASVLFQAGAAGRAEFGLAGDDDFHLKVSPDNFSTSYEAMIIDKGSGLVHSVPGLVVGAGAFISGTSLIEAAKEGYADIALAAHDASGYASIIGYRSRGTRASPAAVQANDNVFNFFCRGYDGSAYRNLGGIRFFVDGTPGANDMPGRMTFHTSTDGTSDLATRMTVYANGGVVIGSPTGGSKGAGTLNASAVYDDNTLLTCYVFDQALDGAVDAAKWDAKVPDRIEKDEEEKEVSRTSRAHLPMRKFAARIGTDFDPLTLDGYARHWREKRHLTSMPNEAAFDPEKGMAAGEWIQRLVETAEIQAVLIETLNQRLKAVEEGPGGVKRA
jgi:hypothetical protein